MAKFNGTDLLVYVGNTPIAHSTSATLSVEADLPDATTKDSGGWADSIAGLKSWSIDFDGLVDYAASYGAEELFDNLKNGNVLTVKFSTSTGGDSFWTGSAFCSSWSMTAEMEAPVSFSGTFTGKGTLTKSTV